jgi:hypothetical protein
VIGSVAHIVGDLQAIGDLSLVEVKSLTLPSARELDVDNLALPPRIGAIGEEIVTVG